LLAVWCVAADTLHCALFAFPGFVQSKWRVAVATLVCFITGLAGVAAALHTALFLLLAFEQS
jgi:hypothetical protein